MRAKTLFAIALSILMMPTVATWAGGQRGGSRGGGQDRGDSAVTRQSAPRPADTPRTQVRATTEQNNRYQEAVQTGSAARQQVRSLIRAEKSSGAGLADARTQRDRLRESVRTMNQVQDRLVGSFDEGQQIVLQERIRRMEHSMEQLHARHLSLDGMLDDPAADGKQFTRRARELERAMKTWEKEYRKLGSELGVES